MNLIEKAEAFARRYHAGQKYGNGLDYCDAHLSKVVSITKGFTTNEVTHIIAWLHDILEDTNIDQTTLVNEFGDYITKQVLTLGAVQSEGHKLTNSPCQLRDMSCPRLSKCEVIL